MDFVVEKIMIGQNGGESTLESTQDTRAGLVSCFSTIKSGWFV